MKTENPTPEIDELFDEYNQIEDDADQQIINFAEEHFENLIHCKSDDVVIIEGISTILIDYLGALGLCHKYKQIIDNKDIIINFISQLKGKSSKYEIDFHDVEFTYAIALIEQEKNFQNALLILNRLNQLYPNDEDITRILRETKFAARGKWYILIFISTSIIASITLLLKFLLKSEKLEIVSGISWALIVIILIVYFIDLYREK